MVGRTSIITLWGDAFLFRHFSDLLIYRIIIKCNGIRRTIFDENAAIPSGAKELADYLAKFDLSIESKISSLLVAATLPLVGGDDHE